MTRSVGILGGTFDPPHIGHLVAADQVLDQLGLTEVRLVVSNQPWQKSRLITPAHQRLALVEALVADAPGVEASAIEIELGGPSYTLVTLAELTRREPGTEWLVVVGADAAAGLPTWHEAETLRRTHRFVVVTRPGVTAPIPEGWDCQVVEIPPLDISSTGLRAMVAAGRSIRHLTPEPVARLLQAWQLYRS